MTASRYIVGIDLGTTNCALSYVDTGEGETINVRPMPVPQVVAQGVVEDRPLLPSFLYLPGDNEQPAGSLDLPWAKARDEAVGLFAREFGSRVPARLVSSAKSWLCHGGVDRRAPILPWNVTEEVRRVSPVEACSRYLRHLADAWNHVIAGDVAEHRLEQQEIVLTVPASFDAGALDLTMEAAKAAGLENVTLLEEPQAAFYAWIHAGGDGWREQVNVGDVVLVCDVGGGTTDLSLIAVGEENGQLALTRKAVGDHILLGGDNMDLALAHAAAAKFAEKGNKLDSGQMQTLWHACRQAKETLFQNPKKKSEPVTVLGRGRKVIGGTLKQDLNRDEVNQLLIDGFFPECKLDDQPRRQRTVGLQEMGLPYAADPAVTKHLAHFLHQQSDVWQTPGDSEKGLAAVLFNGGVFNASVLRDRLLSVVNTWTKGEPIRDLHGVDLDRAVATGAAYYGMVRRGKGVRIRGGTARAYYIGIETSLPAVPGAEPPLKALCVAPFGMEEGTETELPKQEFGLVVGEPAEFRFLGSTVRRDDTAGLMLDDWDDDIEELPPIAATLESSGDEGQTVPVHLHAKVTEMGTLELWCLSRDGEQRWKLELNVREKQ